MNQPPQASSTPPRTSTLIWALALLPLLLSAWLPARATHPQPLVSETKAWSAAGAAQLDPDSARLIERFEALSLSQRNALPEADARRFLDELANTYHRSGRALQWLEVLETQRRASSVSAMLARSWPRSMAQRFAQIHDATLPYLASLILELLWSGEENAAQELFETHTHWHAHPDMLAVCVVLYGDSPRASPCLQRLLQSAPDYHGLGLDARQLAPTPTALDKQ
ncbi:MAG: hypothetical protein RBU37_00890 [Myxococcota bacterium]|jgi:hypothetical protein|nr:hypothetical protein [Myxococcota bacterium]